MSTSATTRTMPTHAFQSISFQQAQTQQCAHIHTRTPTNHQRVQCGDTLQAHQRREQIAIGDLVRERARSLTQETVSLRERTQRALVRRGARGNETLSMRVVTTTVG